MTWVEMSWDTSRCLLTMVGWTPSPDSGHPSSKFVQTVFKHFETCNVSVKEDIPVDILGQTIQGEVQLFTLEALWIRQLKP